MIASGACEDADTAAASSSAADEKQECGEIKIKLIAPPAYVMTCLSLDRVSVVLLRTENRVTYTC